MAALRALARSGIEPRDALRGSGYGVVQGAIEAGEDPANAAVEAVEAALQVAPELGLSGDEAAAALTLGALEAAEAAGEEPLYAVRRALNRMDWREGEGDCS